ncbi:FHA domain-containing protein, partial [bacterium]|nr:FHA domain-containing protein [bacterium]
MSTMGEIFVLVREPGAGPKRVPIPEGGVVVGRVASPNGIVLSGNAVSREHCKLDRKGDTVTVTNLSKTGTLRNGQALAAPATLTVGDTLKVADAEIVFLGLYAAPAQSAAPPAAAPAGMAKLLHPEHAQTAPAPAGEDTSWIPGPPPKETDEQRVARLPT